MRNILAYSISHLCYGDAATTSTCRWENATFDQVTRFNDTTNCTHYLTNCILVAVTNTGPYSGSCNVSNSDPSNVFQTVGAGSHYLLSDYRNLGTTNVAILSDLRQLTTYPPILLQPTNDYYANTNLVLFPQAMRDTDEIDLGAHMVPLDFIFGWAFVTNSTILLTNGVAVAMFAPVAGAAGVNLSRDATFISEGLPNAMNHIVRYNVCQEQANNWGTNRGIASLLATYQSTTPGTIRFRFTDFSIPAQDNDHVQGYPSGIYAPIDFLDCQFHGGTLTTGSPKFNLTNCLFERVGVNLNGDYPFDTTMRSCTFYGGSWNIYQDDAGTWTFLDNIFDKTSISASIITITNDYNGYLTNSDRLPSHGTHDVVLATNDVGYQIGTLGSYYLPTNSAFLDKSCVTNAALIGMYWYTTLTNQTRELTNRLDLGFHVVSTDSAGNPLDGDNDGWFDFLEDINGNGTVNSGETDPNSVSDLGLRVQITNPKNSSNIP